jgi:hypothetical protein
MSMEHRAFAFDGSAFEGDLLPILVRALATRLCSRPRRRKSEPTGDLGPCRGAGTAPGRFPSRPIESYPAVLTRPEARPDQGS